MYLHVLPNGLRVSLERIPRAATATVALGINHGSKDEDVSSNGVAHLIEHLMFHPEEASEESARQLKELAATGARYNAITTKEYTQFHVTLASNHLVQAMVTLKNMATAPPPKPRLIEKEKEIVRKELLLYQNSSRQIFELFSASLWGNRSLGLMVIGTDTSIAGISEKLVADRIHRYYAADNASIAVVGGFEPEAVLEQLHDLFSDWHQTEGIISDYVVQESPSIIVHSERASENVLLCIGYPGLPAGDPYQYVPDILGNTLAGDLSGRIIREVRENRQLVYQVSPFVTHYKYAGAFGSVMNCRSRDVEEVVAVILNEMNSVRKAGITEAELGKAKAQLATDLYMRLENSVEHAQLLASASLQGRVFMLNDVIRRIGRVSSQDIQEVARRILKPSKVSFAAIGSVDAERVANLL